MGKSNIQSLKRPSMICLLFIVLSILILIQESVDGFHVGWNIGRRWTYRDSSYQLEAGTRKSFYDKSNPSPKDPNSNRPYVQRPIRWVDRIPLTNIELGQKYRGLIISVRGYGLYVDIGAQTDGIVHISDASDKYFVHSLSDRFTAGQEIDCWVNQIDAKENRIRLQTYPFHQKERKEGEVFDWDNYTVGSVLEGRVVKFSDYGAYVDVGAPVLAFMHRLKMLSNRRQRKLKSWEIYPLGTDVKALVYQIDPQRKRIEITTFPQEVWDWRFPRPHEKVNYKDDEDDDDSDDEEDEENPDGVDYSSRRNSAMFGLEKELEEDDEDEKGEILTSEEVRKLTGKRLLIDDFTTNEDDEDEGENQDRRKSNNNNNQTKKKKRSDSLLSSFSKDEEMTTSELFTELTNGHYYLTLNHLKKWYYIQTFLEDGYLNNDQLRRLFRDAGGFRGRLNEDQFEHFLEMFQEELGLHEEDEVEIDDEGNVIVPEREENDEDEEGEEYEYVDEDEDVGAEDSRSIQSKDAKLTIKNKEDDQMMDFIESDLHYFGKHFEDLVNSNEEVTLQSFQQTSSPSTPSSTTNQKASPQLIKTKSPKKSLFRRKAVEEEVKEEIQDIKRMTLPPTSQKVINVINPQPTNTIYENILANSFNDLRKRSEGVNVEDVLRWKLTKSMIEDKVIVESEVREIFQKMTDGRSLMNFQQFQRFSDELRVLDLGRGASQSSSLKTNDERSSTTKKLPSNTPYNPKKTAARAPKRTLTPSFQPTEAPVTAPSYQPMPSRQSEAYIDDDMSPSTSTSPSLNSNFISPTMEDEDDSIQESVEVVDVSDEKDEQEQEEEQDDDEEDDEEFFLKVMQESEEKDEKELIESMFQGFANGKQYVKASALLEWDLVFNLIGSGILTEDSFRAKIKEMSNGKPGLDVAGFDQLLTDLLLMYQDPDDGKDTSETAGEKVLPSENSSTTSHLTTEIQETEENESLQVDESSEESLELNIDDSFEELANGKDYVTPQAIREWDFIKELLETGALSEIDLNRTLASIQPKKKNRFTIHDFALCMDELLILSGFDVEGYEEREFSDYGEPPDENDVQLEELLKGVNVNELIGTEILESEDSENIPKF